MSTERKHGGACPMCGQTVYGDDAHGETCPERLRCRALEVELIACGIYGEAGRRIAQIAAMRRKEADHDR